MKLATQDPFTGKSNSCSPVSEYAAGDVSRIPPWHVIENGNRLLLPLGDRKADSRVVPLVLRAGAK
ncbi:hypothetical protein TPA0598_05_04060 [Streptomyces lydicamycinicus]|uniref:Uncharacterized protein n=1 Tax=Streptomyces lydicamycinicus TaxID=1546107 RepID=A0A0P4R8K5_9ACTN|nr:hypothetical protein [Streptomyces lydicamycinicus]GAO09684.1 hypothetical protein TPA0598_05_04060 [Streptomyces lydicamycinicus]